jgi:excisionase family DNA binding protein
MATRSPEADILMIDEAAEHLKITGRTIYRLAAAKMILAYKCGRNWRFSPTDIDTWIGRQSMEAATGRAMKTTEG